MFKASVASEASVSQSFSVNTGLFQWRVQGGGGVSGESEGFTSLSLMNISKLRSDCIVKITTYSRVLAIANNVCPTKNRNEGATPL